MSHFYPKHELRGLDSLTLPPTRPAQRSSGPCSVGAMIEVIKSKFHGAGKEGDFAWMIEQPRYGSTLFIFNDNERQFYTHFNGGEHTCTEGGGNAKIRAYQCLPVPRAIGIPTGTYEPGIHFKGYSALDEHVHRVLNDAFGQIETLLATGHYDSLAFSWNPETKFGGEIFKTAQVVRDHIVEMILATSKKF